MDADQQGRRRRLHAGEVPGGRPVRPQAARPPGAARSGSGSRTTAASTAPTTAARTGSGSTATASRASFGFPIALDPRDPDVAYVDPRGGRREPRHLRTGGSASTARATAAPPGSCASNGLPEHAWAVILREASSFDRLDPAGVYFGTQGGSVWVSPSEGDDWVEAATDCPADPLGRSRRSGRRSPPVAARDRGRRAEALRARGGDGRRRAARAAGGEPALRRARRAAPARQRLRGRDRRALGRRRRARRSPAGETPPKSPRAGRRQSIYGHGGDVLDLARRRSAA